MRPARRSAQTERGAALLTVLLLVAVIAVIAANALERLRLATRLGANAVGIEQARGFAEAAEVLAASRITTLLAQNPGRVTLAGGWSDAPIALPVPGGTAVARVTDGGNCFNLNSLVTTVAPGIYASNPLARLQFARLQRLIGIPAQVAEQVAGGAADWIDSDAEQQVGGAEDGSYLGQDPGYRTAGTLMTDPSELRAIAGVTPEVYAQLRPWLCALPIAAAAPVNVDTLAPEQAPLVAMLAPDSVGVERVRGALLRRPPQGYANAGDFWRVVGSSDTGTGAGVTSTWFTLRVDVAVGGTDLHESALIDATTLPARLVRRQWGEE